ncbi:PUL domain-containing protein [Lasiosphaeris hirsuta]|uniref:PUL domain-containing protein n=1 Tax=Lasiosphaeris hirsuta TaxID=260670 RepID=A0AA40EAI7_9PEZI|nr:PUL domain-containing protein [Lasiosphaeris hirsuta]
MPDFKLSAQLKGHESDVRDLVFPNPDTIISSSRDKTVRLWRKTASKPPTFDDTIIASSSGYINSVAYFPPSEAVGPDGLVASGGHDAIIEVKKPLAIDPGNPEQAPHLVIGHAGNVCTLDVSPSSSYLVSGGWDGKAVVWDTKTWERAKDLLHEGNDNKSVWAVLAYSEDIIITGCADSRIRIFNLRGSGFEVAPKRSLLTADVVRALCKLPTDLKGQHPSGAQFASAGNDSVIRLWKLDGTQVGSLYGHESFIYSLASLPTGEIASAGEDRTLRIWRGKECVQTITHPAISVWTVASARNGDIVSGASDNIVRVFTRSAERTATPEAIEEFVQSVKASAISQEELGSVNKANLDDKEWLETNLGTKDGQQKMIREEDGTTSLYRWSQSLGAWDLVGTVVESAGSSGRKVTHNGREYDYVFDVDIAEGQPPLKLPYNLGEDSFQAATKFLNDNELPISYLESVANFIRENTKTATLGESSEARPPANTYSQETSGAKYLPHTKYLDITTGRLDAGFRKLKEFNQAHIEAGNKHISMNPDDSNRLEALVKALAVKTEDRKPGGIPNVDNSKQLIFNILTQWPYNNRLPALDILRCMAPWPGVASLTDYRYGNVVSIALRGALDTEQPVEQDDKGLAEFLQSKVDWSSINANNVMMALRTIINLFSTPEGRALVAQEAHAIIPMLARVAGVGAGAARGRGELVGQNNNNLQIALISTAFNYACLTYNQRQRSPNEAIDLGLLSQILDIAEVVANPKYPTPTKQNDTELLFRAVMTAGMILASPGETRELGKAMLVGEWLSTAAKDSADPRIKIVVGECIALLKRD